MTYSAEQISKILLPESGPYIPHIVTESDRPWLDEVFKDSIVYSNSNHAIVPYPSVYDYQVHLSRIWSVGEEKILWNYSVMIPSEGKVMTLGFGIHPSHRDQGHREAFTAARFAVSKERATDPDLIEWTQQFKTYSEVVTPSIAAPTKIESVPQTRTLDRGELTAKMSLQGVYDSLEES